MQHPLISVIVPVYNVEPYLRECIDSLLRQTYSPVEIILVDDGSTDGCPAICDRYAAAHEHVSVIHQPNKGLSGARNTGIDAAKGTLLSFVDSDDVTEPDMLERLYALLRDNDADIASSGIDIAKPISGVYDSEQALMHILKEDGNLVTSAWGKLYRAELFTDIRYPEGLIYEDFATTPLLFDKAERIAHTGDILYHYRRDNETSIMHSAFNPKRLVLYTVSDTVDVFLKEHYPHLLKYARTRRTRYSITFFKEAAQCDTHDRETEKVLVKNVRQGIFPYLFSCYKLTSKAYGLLIAVCPPLAARLFKE